MTHSIRWAVPFVYILSVILTLIAPYVMTRRVSQASAVQVLVGVIPAREADATRAANLSSNFPASVKAAEIEFALASDAFPASRAKAEDAASVAATTKSAFTVYSFGEAAPGNR